MNIDLHCHSTASDGLLKPGELVARAAANGVEVLALTDHDDVSGLAEARAEAQSQGVRFVDGVEISVTWERTTVHIVGLQIDRSEEHTFELQSRVDLVCRLLLEKKKKLCRKDNPASDRNENPEESRLPVLSRPPLRPLSATTFG